MGRRIEKVFSRISRRKNKDYFWIKDRLRIGIKVFEILTDYF